MRNNPPRHIDSMEVIYAYIDEKLEECLVIASRGPLWVAIKTEWEASDTPAMYRLHWWKYGTEWSLNKEELQKC